MHLLIALSYLSKDNFSRQIEECGFVDKISEFVEFYSQIKTTGNYSIPLHIYLLFKKILFS